MHNEYSKGISKCEWYKNNNTDKIWWKDDLNTIGERTLSFDRKIEFNMFKDYPDKLTMEQKKIFDDENPHWVDFFKDRCNGEK